MKKKIGIMEKDLRKSLIQYKQDGNLLSLLKAIVTQSDSHIRYYWHFKYFIHQLDSVYDEVIANANDNPSHREGKVTNLGQS